MRLPHLLRWCGRGRHRVIETARGDQLVAQPDEFVVTATEDGNGGIAFLPASGAWPRTGQALLVTPLRVGRLRRRLLCLLLDGGEYSDPNVRAVATDATHEFAAVQLQNELTQEIPVVTDDLELSLPMQQQRFDERVQVVLA